MGFHGVSKVACIGLIAAFGLAPAAPAQQGYGPPGLSASIDADATAVMQELGIVGMTVAVTRDGRLIYSKGFGRSRHEDDGDGGIHAMQPTDRTRIGSLGKPTVSIPATVQALAERGLDPGTAKVYGPDGVLGDTYGSYQRMAIRRFQPILALAISPQDHVHAFYDNGTFSVGTSTDLTARAEPEPFETAPGKRVADLHAVGIDGAGRVHAWYKDGSMSIGTARDLAAIRGTEVDGEVPKVRFPVGRDGDRRSMHDVVGIDFAKSDDDIYVLYDDGTRSSGTPMDFTANFVNRRYASPVLLGQPSRYQIRGVGISARDRVYAWTSSKAFSGTSGNLTAHHEPYDYTHAFDRSHPNRYRDITVAHLFAHRAGFTRSGDVAGAARTFRSQVPPGTEPSYDLIHKHFVLTRPLMSDPGTRYAYSNHGIGLTTLLVEALTDRSFEDYTVDAYLRPMGLKGRVRPQRAMPDGDDSFAYHLQDGGPVPVPFEAATTGLAAGGWTASAQGVLAVTAELARRYSAAEMGAYGWHVSRTGRLHHSGSIGGGYAYASLFPPGYVHPDGHDVAGIHVAIASNTRDSRRASAGSFGSGIRRLAGRIAIQAGSPNAVPAELDYWPQAWD
jgi:CubicO group peptidase (beta-lactamase class C family)